MSWSLEILEFNPLLLQERRKFHFPKATHNLVLRSSFCVAKTRFFFYHYKLLRIGYLAHLLGLHYQIDLELKEVC